MEIGGSSSPAVPSAKVAEPSISQRVLVAAFVVAGVAYLAWRPGTFNPHAMAWSTILYAAEVFGFACAMLYVATCWRLRRRSPLPVPANATIAVLVPTGDESVDIVRRTLMAAQRMKHAHDVWLLDDGSRLERQVLAEELGCRYLARATGADGRAGTLNHALRHTRAEFIAVFDADHAPAPTFLDETLGFFRDDGVAFVQTPQDFYNLDSFQHRFDRRGSSVWHEQTPFFRIVQAGKDRLDAATFCGSCAVIRRRALDDVGGFAAGTSNSDLHTSIRLHKRGWKSVYYSRSLAFGLAPPGVVPFLEQRRRAAMGAMQVWRQEGVLFTRGLSVGQRIAYLATMLGCFEGWQRAIFYLAPAVVLATGTMPIAVLDAGFLARIIPFYLLGSWAREELARGYGRTLLAEQYSMMRFGALIAATFGYFQSAAGHTNPSKVARTAGATLRSLWPQCLVLCANAVAILVGLAMFRADTGLPITGLVGHLLWASLTIGIAAAGLRFAVRTSGSRRREYRFPLPIPLRVQTSRGPSLGLATDISPLGCRVVGAPVGGARSGDELRGELLLPTGPLPVFVIVRTVLADSRTAAPSALGCQFRWGLADERDQLELFLFGSDLQWRLNGFEDRVRTPLERIGDRLRGVRPVRRRLANLRWSPVVYRRVNSQHDVGIGFISAADPDGATRTLVSLGVLPANGRLFAEEVTPAGPRGVVGRLADEQVLETHAAPIYLYKLTA